MGYDKPEIFDYGTLEDVTLGTQTGEFSDRDFPEGTPRDELTFS